MDLPTFLLARTAEDEAAARKADAHSNPAAEWEADEPDCVSAGGYIVATGIDDESIGAHIARHDPARVLAECAAKRAMIQAWPDPMGQWNAAEADAARAMKRQVLLSWARVHADHPDFDPAWR